MMSENHVRDGIRQPYETPAHLPYLFSKVVWRAPSAGEGGPLGAAVPVQLQNPEPARVIQQIEFVSAHADSELVCGGADAGSRAAGRATG